MIACERKKRTAYLITEVCLGLVNTLLNWFANKQHISYFLSVNVLFSGLSRRPPVYKLFIFSIPKEVLRINLDFRNSNMNFIFQMAAADFFVSNGCCNYILLHWRIDLM